MNRHATFYTFLLGFTTALAIRSAIESDWWFLAAWSLLGLVSGLNAAMEQKL